MKLNDLNLEVALFEARVQVSQILSESIIDYFALVIARLRGKSEAHGLDIDQLSDIIAGLKVLIDDDHREALTKTELGINPNSYREFLDLLKAIPKDGKSFPQKVHEVFAALKSIAPSLFKKTREELKALESGSKAEFHKAVDKISAFATLVNQMFHRINSLASA